MSMEYPAWQHALGAYVFLFAGAVMAFGAIESIFSWHSLGLALVYLVASPILLAIGIRYALHVLKVTAKHPPFVETLSPPR